MIKQNLNTDWTLRRADSQESFPASVPTSVYTVLAANKKIPEPYWKGNEDRGSRTFGPGSGTSPL